MTHRSSQNVLLRGVDRGKVVAAIERRLDQDGYTRVKGATTGVRLTIRQTRDEVLLTVEPGAALLLTESANGWQEVEWAEHLAEALDVTALAIGVYEDGPGSHVTRFEAAGDDAPSFELADDARKIPAELLGTAKAVSVKEPSGEAFGTALRKALRLPNRWLHLWDADDEGETLVFRRRAEPPLLPRGAPKASGFEPAATAYRGREYAVGTFAFGAEAHLDSVASVFTELVRAFCPADGLRVHVTRGTKSEILPFRFSRTASIKAAQLSRGGSVELTAGPLFDKPMAGLPIFWIANDPAVMEEEAAVPLHFGFALIRPGADAPERALAHAMSVVTEVACGIEGCLAAVVAAQGLPISLASTALPYEMLAGTAQHVRDGSWLRKHARAPGWRVLVPRARVRRLARPPPDGVTLARCPNGVLVQSDAPTPFALGATDEIERWLLPAFADNE